ncbi:hypothetical protein AB0C33_15310 [Nonomuraea sp. NPDC048881]
MGIGPLYGQHIPSVSGLVPLIVAASQVPPDRIDQLLADSMS